MNKAVHSTILSLFGVTILSGLLLSTSVSADTEVIDQIRLTVPIACTMTGTGTTHTATLSPGAYSGASGSEYENGIGKTTLTAICNDDNGFSIYAIGYTGNSYDDANHTKLIGQNTNGAISTKAYASGDTTSNWSMKLTKVDNPVSGDPVTYNPQNLTISTGYDAWHAIPDTYTKVAQYKANTGSSTTDTTLGVKLETTYAAYIASNQPADTYVGQVKYTMVHPYDNTAKDGPITDCPANKICYSPNANDIEGTMGQQSITSSATSATLLASNFSRVGYGFAGWSDRYDYINDNGAYFYGPQEEITFTAGQYSGTNGGLRLYAIWVPSAGSLQDSTKVATLCGTGAGSLTQAPTDGTANLSSVSALTDQRDGETYAIAKLADGNCWMIENLRLESTNSDNSAGALAQGYGTSATYGNFSGLADAETANFTATNGSTDATTANSLYYAGTQEGTATINISQTNYAGYRMPRYNNYNHKASSADRPQNPTTNQATNSTTDAGMYSYGNYYTWAAAIADTTYFSANNQSVTNTSLCPSGWRLPKGGDKTRIISNNDNEFWNLIVTALNGGTLPANYNSSTTPFYTGSAEANLVSNKLRSYPNNFLYSGYFYMSSTNSRGGSGYYWSSTAFSIVSSYKLSLLSSSVTPSTNGGSKIYSSSIRCMVSPGA